MLVIAVGFSVALGACALVDPVDSRYDTVTRSLAKARNEAIFLNLIRASHDYPLSFAAIGSVSPQITNTTSLALPNFMFGPHIPTYPPGTTSVTIPLFSPGRDVIFGNTTAGNTTAVQTLFQVTTLETGAFYQGFLRPIDLQTLNYFIRQGYPRELLFWLFTDSFEMTLPTGHYGYHYSPPDDYGCSRLDPKHRCFVDWVHNAAFTGLTVEEKSPNSTEAKSKTTYARFCFNEVLGQQAAAMVSREQLAASKNDLDIQTSLIYSSDYVCGSDSWNPMAKSDQAQPDILPLTLGPSGTINIKIVPRSAYGVFEFLGTLIKLRQEHILPSQYAYIPLSRRYAVNPPTLETVPKDRTLIDVVRNMGGECFVHTWFEDGDYCVPEEAETTKRLFSLLAQLIAIQTTAADLSIQPIFHVTQ
jgi:hypothetical protein